MDIASLGIKVDSTDAAQASTDLDKLTKSGERAEQSAVGLMKEMDSLEKSLSKGATSTQELAKQREALTKLTKTGAYGEAEFAKITGQLDKQQAALVKSTQDEQKALTSLLASIDPASAAISKLDVRVEKLGKHLDAGRISQDQYNSALGKIDKDYAKLERTATGFEKLRLGSRQAQENVVQLGNALSSGDWGSGVRAVAQLGAGAGASASSLLAILGPFALATAAVGGLGFAYYKGSEEQDSYSKSLILTGNAAGLSADQLGAMAQQIGATVGTTGQAAEVLALLAGNGKIAGESFAGITQAAVSMKEATGKAVSETVAEFVKLADEPVKASAALNDQYHYLTASVYSQIAALEEQGNHAGAVKLATEQFADAINARTPKILENLSFWEKGYNAVAKAADGLKNIGRPDVDADIAQAQSDLDAANRGEVGLFQNKQVMIDYYDNKLNMLRDEKAAKADIAKFEGEQAKAQQSAVSAMEKIDALTKSSLTNEQKRADAIKDYKKQLEDIRKVDPNDSRLNQSAIDKNLSNINDKFKDAKGPGNQLDLTGANDAQNQLKSITGYYDNIQKELEAAQKAGLVSAESYSSQRVAIVEQERVEVAAAYEAEISALEAVRAKTGTSSAQRIQLDQKIADARTNMVKAEQDASSQLEVLASAEAGRIAKQTQAISTYTDALNQQNAALQRAGQRAATGVGQGDRQASLSGSLNGIEDRANQQRLDLARDKADKSRNMSAEEYQQKLDAINRSEKDLAETTLSNYEQMSAAQSDWRNGATSAFSNYLESARNVAGQTKSLFTNAFTGMEDAIVNFAMTGKGSFADFTKSILADMARIATRQASSALLSSLVGAATSYFTGGAGTGNGLAAGSAGATSSNLGASQAGYSSTYLTQANGGAWKNGVQMFANGGAFTNSVVSKPTAFGMSGGQTGVMGEAGPEAIMPLTRTSNGKLGVMSMGGGSGGTQINVEVHIDGDGSATSVSDAPGYDLFGKELATFVEQKYQELRTKDMRQGGVINNAIKGR